LEEETEGELFFPGSPEKCHKMNVDVVAVVVVVAGLLEVI